MASPVKDHKHVQTHGPALPISELRAKTIWIRDTLEPSVALHGPLTLAPDTVLELNSFFYKLLALSKTAHFDKKPSITREALSVSRIHRAIILIAGRGTRWPGRLVGLCDELIEDWTRKFGDLDDIRPLLYEKGGRLEMLKEERDMGRHELLIKWMSDPNCMVSPLRALEHGHLEFKPGQWWIHPLFAFHAGIIDSPDPHGGISADSDGAYAILLTAYDEVIAENPESFTYRCRSDDPGRFRLLGGILPPATSVRILRSHTLHSVWSPPAGIRYDGLYRIKGYSLKKPEKNAATMYDITFERELDQVSMREVRLHPTSEEVDDYIEYKRLRGERHDYKEPKRRDGLPGSGDDDDDLSEKEQEDDGQESIMTVKPARSTPTWDEPSPFSVTQEEIDPFRTTGGLSPSRARPRYSSVDPIAKPNIPPAGGIFDGAASTRGSVSSTQSTIISPISHNPLKRPSTASIASLERIRYCWNMTESDVCEDQIAWIRRDSAHYSRPGSKTSSPRKYSVCCAAPSDSPSRADSIISYAPDHKTLSGLATNVRSLRDITLRKVSVGSSFREDLAAMQEIVTGWQVDSAETYGFVDHCLKRMERDITAMKEHKRFDWQELAKEKRRSHSVVEELSTLRRYQRRYEGRVREEVGEQEERVRRGEVLGREKVGLVENPWVFGQELVLY